MTLRPSRPGEEIRKDRCTGWAWAAKLNLVCIRLRPACPNRFRRSSSCKSSTICLAKDSGSPAATSSPVSPSAITSGRSPHRRGHHRHPGCGRLGARCLAIFSVRRRQHHEVRRRQHAVQLTREPGHYEPTTCNPHPAICRSEFQSLPPVPEQNEPGQSAPPSQPGRRHRSDRGTPFPDSTAPPPAPRATPGSHPERVNSALPPIRGPAVTNASGRAALRITTT